jgi:hypothetical protein
MSEYCIEISKLTEKFTVAISVKDINTVIRKLENFH